MGLLSSNDSCNQWLAEVGRRNLHQYHGTAFAANGRIKRQYDRFYIRPRCVSFLLQFFSPFSPVVIATFCQYVSVAVSPPPAHSHACLSPNNGNPLFGI